MNNTLAFITKILTDGEAWITNGKYRLFEKDGEYVISEKRTISVKHDTSSFIPIQQFSDMAIAIAEYAELVTGEQIGIPIPEMIRIPAGEFLMGSDPAKDTDAYDDEQPQRCVSVSEFYIGKYPVTNEQYAAFVKATKHEVPDHWKEGKIPLGKENHPVVYVSWDDATAYCAWLSEATGQSFRLPAEAEWEKAARGTDGRIYPWGDEWDKTKLNSSDGGLADTTSVGRYSPDGDSPYGVADMAGNVWEWCANWYDEKERDRVLRGGSFYGLEDDARCASRDWGDPSFRFYLIGFRVVVSPIGS